MSHRGEREAGFTIIEVVVAIFVLVMAALATFGLLSAATKNTARAKGTQVAMDRAQQEMEALRSLTYTQLAMKSTPVPSEHPLNPDYRVSGSRFALTREPPSDYQTMVVNEGEIYGEPEKRIEGGVVVPSEHFESGEVSGTVHRYVVWRNDERCGESCPGPQDYKQIIVAVKLNTPNSQPGERGYVEVQSDFVNPIKSPATDPLPGEHGVVTAQQFFLTDTPCAEPAPTARQPIEGNHPLHNTLGTCASGPQESETTPGAPDALLLSPPPMPETGPPPLFDYSSNFTYPAETSKGVQLVKEKETEGCPFYNEWKSGTSYIASKVHLWVTDPMKSEFKMTGRVTIEFYTRTITDEEKTRGSLCVYLFKREEKESKAIDTRLTEKNSSSLYWVYTPENNNWWPSKEWAKERRTMEFNGAPYTIPAGDRLGVAISVEEKNTNTVAIPIVYDHPSYPTRIEVDTNTPIEGG